MERLKYFLLGVVFTLLVFFVFKAVDNSSDIGRYRLSTVQQSMRSAWVIDTKTGVAKLIKSRNDQ